MAPFDTNDFVTCWIPLQIVPAQEDGGSGLSFASGSHRSVNYPFLFMLITQLLVFLSGREL